MTLLGSMDSFFFSRSYLAGIFFISRIEEIVISRGYVVHFRVTIFFFVFTTW